MSLPARQCDFGNPVSPWPGLTLDSLPLGLEGPAVVVLEAERVVLSGVAVRNLHDPAALFPRVPDPMRFLRGDHELVSGMGVDDPVPDLDGEAGIEDEP